MNFPSWIIKWLEFEMNWENLSRSRSSLPQNQTVIISLRRLRGVSVLTFIRLGLFFISATTNEPWYNHGAPRKKQSWGYSRIVHMYSHHRTYNVNSPPNLTHESKTMQMQWSRPPRRFNFLPLTHSALRALTPPSRNHCSSYTGSDMCTHGTYQTS